MRDDSVYSFDQSTYVEYKKNQRRYNLKQNMKRLPLVLSAAAVMVLAPLALVHATTKNTNDTIIGKATATATHGISTKVTPTGESTRAQGVSAGQGATTQTSATTPQSGKSHSTTIAIKKAPVTVHHRSIVAAGTTAQYSVHSYHTVGSTSSTQPSSTTPTHGTGAGSTLTSGPTYVPAHTAPTHSNSPVKHGPKHNGNQGNNNGHQINGGNHAPSGNKPGNNHGGNNGTNPGNNHGNNGTKPSNNHANNGTKPGNNHGNNGTKPGNNGNSGNNAPYVGGPKKFKDFNQGDWGSRIASTGCGPTSAAMVVSTLTGRNITPAEMAKQLSPKYYIPGSGTTTAALPYIGKKHTSINVNHIKGFGDVNRTLRAGGLVIVHAKPGHFTSAGHYMVIRYVNKSGDRYTLADPNNAPGRDSEKKTWTADQLRNNGIDDLWAFTPRR